MLKNPIDRPFRSREEIEMEQALEAQYHELAIIELREALARDQEAEQAAA